MKRAIKAELIVDVGENSLANLVNAVCRYLESKGFKTALPHVYPEDPMIIEITETIPTVLF